jgi:hypothetical protein
MILTALLMFVFLGIASLAIDIARIILAKQECQNAADAGALAGARYLVPYVSTTPPTPDWSSGQSVATQTVNANKSDHTLLTDSTVQVGYWHMLNKTMQSTATVPTIVDVPAVSVTVARAAGQNSGPVLATFARIFGMEAFDVSAQSIAILPCPGTAPPNSVFPIAIAEELLIQHWNDDPPFDFNIGSDYHYPDDQAGQWTSFLQDINNVDYCHDLIDNGNPDQVNVGDDIWIQPGTETSMYKYVNDKISEMKSLGMEPIVFVPVVQTDFQTHNFTPVLTFAPLYLEKARGANNKYISAHFVRDALFPTNNTSGKCYGGFVPPRLVR